jgi:beta-glucosidase
VTIYQVLPPDLLLGVASSAPQTEEDPAGEPNSWAAYGLKNSGRLAKRASRKGRNLKFGQARVPDWPLLEPDLSAPRNYEKGRANGSYSDWRGPIRMAADLEQQVYRFSISWQRVMQLPGQPDPSAIEHYQTMIKYIQGLGMKAWVTIWHFDEPPWFTRKGGWEAGTAADDFAEYVESALPILLQADHVTVLNEPNGYAFVSRIYGAWPPNRRLAFRRFRRTRANLIAAHRRAYDSLKAAGYARPVSSSINLVCFEAADGLASPISRLVCRLANRWYNHNFLRRIRYKVDEIDVQYYLHMKIKWGLVVSNDNKRLSDVGWELYPEGLYPLVIEMSRYGLTVNLTEFGLADARDQHRVWYHRQILQQVLKVRQAGVRIGAVLQWTLVDNYEWAEIGFAGRFGLFEMAGRFGNNPSVRPRPSAHDWAAIAQSRMLPTTETDAF